MNPLKSLAFVVVAVAIAACSKQPSPQGAATAPAAAPDRVLTVKEYYDDDAARNAAIDRCSSASEGQVNTNLQKPQCKNALQADFLHQSGMKPE